MRTRGLIVASGLVFTTACTPVERAWIADIGGRDSGVAYFAYKRGGTLDSYLTVEVRDGNKDVTVVSIADCQTISVKKSDSKQLDVVGFDARMSVGNVDPDNKWHGIELTIAAHAGAPSAEETRKLQQAGFTTLKCSRYL